MKRRAIFLISICLGLMLLFFGSIRGMSDSESSWSFLPLVVSAQRYSFFVAGHTYGVPEVNNSGVHPPFRFLFPQINSEHLAFGVLTGDIVIRGTPSDWDEIDADLDELTPPVYFAVGNHDMTDRALFVSRYGPTYYSFEHQGDLFIVLDGEVNQCNITGEQMIFLQNALSENDWKNVFVFVHRLIWIAEGTPYYILRSKINNPTGYDFRSNFWTEIAPLLRDLDAQVYVVAGDVGVAWAMPLFYEGYENMHLIASGMGGSEEENFLIFDVNPGGVIIRAQRLDGQPLDRGATEAYDLAYYSGLR